MHECVCTHARVCTCIHVGAIVCTHLNAHVFVLVFRCAYVRMFANACMCLDGKMYANFGKFSG